MDKFALSDLFISQPAVINGILSRRTATDFFSIFLLEISPKLLVALIFINGMTGKKYSLIIHRLRRKIVSRPAFLMEKKIKKLFEQQVRRVAPLTYSWASKKLPRTRHFWLRRSMYGHETTVTFLIIIINSIVRSWTQRKGLLLSPLTIVNSFICQIFIL